MCVLHLMLRVEPTTRCHVWFACVCGFWQRRVLRHHQVWRAPAASLSQGLVSVQVLNDDVLYMSSVAYWYEVEVVVSSIWPVSGLMSGGTLVAVHGSNLMSVGATVYCKFGGVSSLARVSSGEMLHCSSPVGGVAGYVGVELSLNEQQYSVGQVLFEYQLDAHVEHVSPAKGGVEGGSLLMVGVVGFSERSGRLSYLVCRFNSSMVSAVYVSGVQLHCITPEHVSGLVSVEVSMNRQQFSTDGVQYEYVEVSLYGVSPVSGPVRGRRGTCR